jgi:hypothetical protein
MIDECFCGEKHIRAPRLLVRYSGPECDGENCDEYEHHEGCNLYYDPDVWEDE